jgi:chromosomal replication initiation ATPase DnaA
MDDFRMAELLIDVVARAGGVKVKQLRGRSTQATLCKLRDTARFLIRQRTKLSFPEIGKLFGGQDHSSVMAACRREQMRLDRNLVHAASGLTWHSWHAHILALLDQELICLAGGPEAATVEGKVN